MTRWRPRWNGNDALPARQTRAAGDRPAFTARANERDGHLPVPRNEPINGAEGSFIEAVAPLAPAGSQAMTVAVALTTSQTVGLLLGVLQRTESA